MKQRGNDKTEHGAREGWKIDFSCTDAPVEEFDDVEDLLAGAVNPDSGAELQEAAGVGGGDDRGAGGLGVAHFIGEQLQGRFGLRHVVDSGGAATDF